MARHSDAVGTGISAGPSSFLPGRVTGATEPVDMFTHCIAASMPDPTWR